MRTSLNTSSSLGKNGDRSFDRSSEGQGHRVCGSHTRVSEKTRKFIRYEWATHVWRGSQAIGLSSISEGVLERETSGSREFRQTIAKVSESLQQHDHESRLLHRLPSILIGESSIFDRIGDHAKTEHMPSCGKDFAVERQVYDKKRKSSRSVQ